MRCIVKYDKTVFKKHYGSLYITLMKYTFAAFMTAVLILVVVICLDLQIPFFMGMGLGLIVFLSIFPCLPIFICQYFIAIKTVQRQTQRIEAGRLIVTFVPENGFAWGAIVTHTQSYSVEKMEEVKVTKRFLEVNGVIHLTDTYNGNVTKKMVTNVRIPRCFSGENEIIKLGRQML